MTPRAMIAFGLFFIAFFLTGVAWYAMTINPSRYRRPYVWLGGATGLFLLYAVFLGLITEPSNIEDIVLCVLFGLFSSVATVFGLWIPMLQRDWIKGWRNSQRTDKTKKADK